MFDPARRIVDTKDIVRYLHHSHDCALNRHRVLVFLLRLHPRCDCGFTAWFREHGPSLFDFTASSIWNTPIERPYPRARTHWSNNA